MRRVVGMTALLLACSDSSSSVGAAPSDAGADAPIVTRPPPNVPPPDNPPSGVDRTGRFGTPALIADLGVSTDGPSWRDADGALYFTVQGTSLRKLVPGAAPVEIAYEDAGAHTPVGTASAGGARVFVTEKGSIAAIDFDDAGAATIQRTAVPNGVVVDVAGDRYADGGVEVFAADITSPTGYAYAPPAFDEAFALDGGTMTGVAARRTVDGLAVWWAVTDHPQYGDSVVEVSYLGTAQVTDVVKLSARANAVAVDESNDLYVAWARGIDVYSNEKLVGMSPGLPLDGTPTSLTFGGADRKTLFVTTASGKIYGIPCTRVGVPR